MSMLKTASSLVMLDQVYQVQNDSFQKYPAWIQTRLSCCPIAGIEGTSVRRHIFGVFINWRKRKASNEVPEDVSRP